MYIIENQQYIYRITNYRQMNYKKSLNSICLSISYCINTLWCRALLCSSTWWIRCWLYLQRCESFWTLSSSAMPIITGYILIYGAITENWC